MRVDKKVKSGRIRLVLLRATRRGAFSPPTIADDALQRTLAAHFA